MILDWPEVTSGHARPDSARINPELLPPCERSLALPAPAFLVVVLAVIIVVVFIVVVVVRSLASRRILFVRRADDVPADVKTIKRGIVCALVFQRRHAD